MNPPIGRVLHKAKFPIAFLGLSIGLAIYVNNTGAFWQFISWLPRSFSERLFAFLSAIVSPFLPVEVYAQEEQLEFFTAWFFSGAKLFALYLSFIAIKAAFRGRTQNAL